MFFGISDGMRIMLHRRPTAPRTTDARISQDMLGMQRFLLEMEKEEKTEKLQWLCVK